jgi:hypothetical protein
MNAMVLISPVHAMVAVETWDGSNEYLRIETTALESARNLYFDGFMFYDDKEGWLEYLEAEEITAIDCNMAKILNIHPIN